jgi:ACS family tartrate transporter-like MFS transporter
MMDAYANEKKAISKLTWRVMPYLMLLYLVCMIDRSNISYAALTMNEDLGIAAGMFGLITGIFFIGYAIFVLPSTLVMHKISSKKYLAIILTVWGLICIAMAFAQEEIYLLVLRFLLGVVEAGFYATIVLLITNLFPKEYLARNISKLAVISVVTGIIQGPICGAILTGVHNFLGLEGWRWLFIIQALPAVILGIITPFVLVTNIKSAKFLSQEDKEWLISVKTAEEELKINSSVNKASVNRWNVLKMPVLWWISIAAFTGTMAAYGVTMWLPLTFQQMGEGLSLFTITLLTVIPFLFGAVVGFVNGWHSDKTLERRYHVAIPLLALTVSLVFAAFSTSLVVTIICMSVSVAGFVSFNGSFYTIPTARMGEAAAVVGVAIINLIQNLGGFFGPTIIGFVQDGTGSPAAGLIFLGAATLFGFIVVLAITKPQKPQKS